MRKVTGFTLIEVLVASVILISALGLTYIGYSQFVLISEKSQSVLTTLSAQPSIKNLVIMNVYGGEKQGELEFEKYKVSWKANIEDSFRERSYDPETSLSGNLNYSFQLLKVLVEVNSQNNKQSNFEFSLLTWTNHD